MCVCSAFAADEIHVDYDSGFTLYAARFQPDGNVFVTDGTSDEVWATAGNYDVTMTENGTGGHYVGSFDTVPNIAAGTYKVTVFEQLGGSPADSDRAIYVGTIVWTGTAEYDTESKIDAILEDTGTTIPAQITSVHGVTDGKIDTTDALITSSHSTTDGHLTDIKGTGFVKDTHSLIDIWTLSNWMRDVMEGDVWTNTATTPWRMEIRTKGTATALIEKELFEIDSTDIADVTQRIGQKTEPSP